jgi:hypothetical protein
LAPDADFSKLDPALGDDRGAMSATFWMRYVVPYFTIDVGFVRMWSALRTRSRSTSIPYADTLCGDCTKGQEAYSAIDRDLILRLSLNVNHFALGVGYGESFVNLPYPTFELVGGLRTPDYRCLFGFGYGYGLGTVLGGGVRVFGNTWLEMGAFVNDGVTASFTVAERWSNDSPL